jgi:acetyl-CoA acyltransferase
MKNVYLVSGTRTPFAKAGTDLKNVHAAELGRFALAELFAKTNLSVDEIGKIVDEVVVGNTGTPADTANIARVIALRAGLPKHISAYTVHRNCASALEAVAQAALKVEAGQADVIVAGGTESMSQMPLMYNNKAVSFFDRLSRAKSLADKLKVMKDLPLGDFMKPRIAIVEGLTDPFCSLNMGQTAEVLAKEFKISRREQDEFALQSHKRAIEAQEAGRFSGEVAPFAIPPSYERTLAADSGPRKNQTLEALAKLKPYFDSRHGTVTVGNSCPITDGAVMLFVASEEGLKKLGGAKPLARIRGYGFAGLEPERMGLGPVFATHRVLEKTKLSLKDFGVFEINEAFAAQVIACTMAFDSDNFCRERLGRSEKMGSVDPALLNPNGGAIAIGHPVGATGARIVLTAALEMKRRKAQYGLATLCIGGGQGGAMALEAV